MSHLKTYSLAFVVFILGLSAHVSLPASDIQGFHPSFLESSVSFPKVEKTEVLEEKSLYEKTGLASWYGPGFYGKKTASGQILNSKMLSAAHPTLAFGTKLQITYLKTAKVVEVEVNDRGPVPKNRLIDLSYAAAKELGILHSGLALVKVVELR